MGPSLPGSPQAAIDPIGLLVFFIIVINVIATFFKRARAQQSKQSDAASSMRMEEAMRKSSADLAAARAAQRARLQQAIDAARQRRIPSPAPPQVVVQVSPSPPKPLPPPPMVAPALDALPSFQFEAQLAPTPTLLAVPQTASAARPRTLPILGGKFSGSDLFVAAAVIGPCAALRTPGHTPAGW